MTTILFDLDGTLLDSTEAILLCFEDAYNDFDFIAPAREKIKVLIGHPLDYMFLHLGVEEDRVWDFVDRYKFHYRKRSKQMTYFLPGAKESILEASTFARLGIVTTKTGSYSIALLEHMGVMKYFDVLIGREDVTHPKPHSEPIIKALHKMNIKHKESIWMIGDTCLDAVSAKDADISSIGVTCGYGSKEQLQRCADIVMVDTKSAVKYIKKQTKL
ncbi:MAG: HAD family hydrolase [Epsilonproteobacteria bacterium]|nr:HAD family hydrolase [Campylobacterota bacterium]